jgi:hypothetical protein
MGTMLFDRQHRKKVQMAWKVLVVLIVLSMILLYAPMF